MRREFSAVCRHANHAPWCVGAQGFYAVDASSAVLECQLFGCGDYVLVLVATPSKLLFDTFLVGSWNF